MLLCNTLNAVHKKDSLNLIQMDFLQNWMLELGTWHDFSVCQDLPENTISAYLNLIGQGHGYSDIKNVNI